MEKDILIAVSGSIAAYKTCDLVRELTKANHSVQVMMTKNATHFVGKITFEALTGKPVRTEEFDTGMAHIDLKNIASLMAIVPASADIIGKMANGIADDLVTSTYLAATCPVIIAPSMNPGMYSKKVVQRNLESLKQDGIIVIEPGFGKVVCGDEGYGKMADISVIQKKILEMLV